MLKSPGIRVPGFTHPRLRSEELRAICKSSGWGQERTGQRSDFTYYNCCDSPFNWVF